jgi:pimeloyl-ACP methyl ester carboxylesterase
MKGINLLRLRPAPSCSLRSNRPTLKSRIVTTSDGVELAVREHGRPMASHIVVLLHGFCLTSDCWQIQIEHVSRRWGNTIRIISYDHRGHGAAGLKAYDQYRTLGSITATTTIISGEPTNSPRPRRPATWRPAFPMPPWCTGQTPGTCFCKKHGGWSVALLAPLIAAWAHPRAVAARGDKQPAFGAQTQQVPTDQTIGATG